MKDSQPVEKKLPKNFTIDSSLNGKYDNDPYFKAKLEEANEFLRKTKLPEEVLNHLQKGKKHN